jgi:hypothetical protein
MTGMLDSLPAAVQPEKNRRFTPAGLFISIIGDNHLTKIALIVVESSVSPAL